MIPLEKLIPIEAKAREYGYYTEINNGGQYLRFNKNAHGGSFTVVYDENQVLLWNPDCHSRTIQKYNEFLEDQRKLLELAMMLQEHIIGETLEMWE